MKRNYKKAKRIRKNFDNFVKDTQRKKYYISIKNLVFCSDIEENLLKGEWNKMQVVIAFNMKIGAIKYKKNYT